MLANHHDLDDAALARAAQQDPWVLYLIARREKMTAAPSLDDLLAAAATATVSLLSDPRASGEWAEAIDQWQSISFRKVALKARASRWEQISELPGVTAAVGAAEVRAVVPVLRSERAAVLGKAQAMLDELEDAALDDRPISSAVRVLWLSPHAQMTSGKAMAQVGHCAQMLNTRLPETSRAAWAAAGFPVSVRRTGASDWSHLLERNDIIAVRDAGLTEVDPGTYTVAALVD